MIERENGSESGPSTEDSSASLPPMRYDGKLFYDPQLADPEVVDEIVDLLEQRNFYFAEGSVSLVRDPELRVRDDDAWLVGASAIKAYFRA
jgi:hypothetical protein